MKMEVINVSKQKQEVSNIEEDFILIHQNSLKIQRVAVFVLIIKMNIALSMSLPVLVISRIVIVPIQKDITITINISQNIISKEWISQLDTRIYKNLKRIIQTLCWRFMEWKVYQLTQQRK